MNGQHNAANPSQVKKKQKREEFLSTQEIDDVKSVLSMPAGRRFIWRYLGFAGVFQTSFTGNSETFLNEGKRMVGLKLMDDITEANPDALTQMMKESKKEKEND